MNKTVNKPWGYYTVLDKGEGFLVKKIVVNPNQKLSVQSHNYRSEHWFVLEGKALVILDKDSFELKKGNSIDIGLKQIHSLQNPFDNELSVLEVQSGELLSEDDIIRYEDIYGRI